MHDPEVAVIDTPLIEPSALDLNCTDPTPTPSVVYASPEYVVLGATFAATGSGTGVRSAVQVDR